METIKILFLSANSVPKDAYLNIEGEYREIETKIRASEFRDRLELIPSPAARPDDWLQKLNQYRPNIVQFSGHGSSDGALVMIGTNGPVEVKPAALKALFQTLKDNVRLVVLNACYSQKQAHAIAEVIDCVIGMNKIVSDIAAINFAASFYRAIGFGRSIQEAFDQGKVSLMLNGLPEEDTPELLVRSGVDASKIAFLATQSPDTPQSSNKPQSLTNKPSATSSDVISIFISYAPQDRKWRDELVKHLSPMKRLGLISTWYDENTNAGAEAQHIAAEQLAAARIILLLISPDYFASDNTYDGELKRALSRHTAGTARVIPILIRDTEGWKESIFGHLQALPRDDRSVHSSKNTDAAMATIAGEIRRVVNELQRG